LLSATTGSSVTLARVWAAQAQGLPWGSDMADLYYWACFMGGLLLFVNTVGRW